jgi:glutathione peroxidase
MLYDIPIRTLGGEATTLSAYRNKALLVVNVASECGLTPQYEQLQKVFERYKDRGFAVLGFPCNQFGKQEPGSAPTIREFCTKNGVTFPLMEKIEVNGKGRHAIYAALIAASDTTGKPSDIQWNFEKFVVAPNARSVMRFRPQVKPDDPAVIRAIEAALPD